MSDGMLDLQKKNAESVAKLARDELRLKQNENKVMADNHLEICGDWYTKKQDTDFPKAEQRISEIVARYRQEEKKKLKAFKEREAARYPKNDEELKEQLTLRASIPKATRSRSNTRGGQGVKKRKRDNSSGSRGRQNDTSNSTGGEAQMDNQAQPQPSTSSANLQPRSQPNQNRDRDQYPQAGRGRGRGRGRARGGAQYQGEFNPRGRGFRGRGIGRGQMAYPERQLARALKDLLHL
jgi:hypothetical protein